MQCLMGLQSTGRVSSREPPGTDGAPAAVLNALRQVTADDGRGRRPEGPVPEKSRSDDGSRNTPAGLTDLGGDRAQQRRVVPRARTRPVPCRCPLRWFRHGGLRTCHREVDVALSGWISGRAYGAIHCPGRLRSAVPVQGVRATCARCSCCGRAHAAAVPESPCPRTRRANRAAAAA